MPFAEFNTTQFPKVSVSFKKYIKNIEDYRSFEKGWLMCYEKQKDFYFIFDTSNVGFIYPNYCYSLTSFISKLKELKKQYLTYSVIIVNNWYIKQLLFFVFQLQKPVAPVYIIEKDISIESLINDINQQKIIKNEHIFIIHP